MAKSRFSTTSIYKKINQIQRRPKFDYTEIFTIDVIKTAKLSRDHFALELIFKIDPKKLNLIPRFRNYICTQINKLAQKDLTTVKGHYFSIHLNQISFAKLPCDAKEALDISVNLLRHLSGLDVTTLRKVLLPLFPELTDSPQVIPAPPSITFENVTNEELNLTDPFELATSFIPHVLQEDATTNQPLLVHEDSENEELNRPSLRI